MAIASVQTASGASSTTTVATSAFAGNTTSGNHMVVAYGSSAATSNNVKSVTDSQGNIYVKAASLLVSNQNLEIWYAQNIVGGTTPTVTASVTTSSSSAGIIAREFSGVSVSSSFGGCRITNSSSVTAYDSKQLPYSRRAAQLLVGCSLVSSSSAVFTLGSGYSNLTTLVIGVFAMAMEERIVSTVGEYNATITVNTSTSGNMGVVAFSDVPQSQTTVLNNYQSVNVQNGMSVSERIR